MPTTQSPRLSEALADVLSGLGEADDVALSSVSADELLAALATLDRIRNRVDGLASKLAVGAETSGAVMRAGARNAAIVMGRDTSAVPAKTRADVRRGRWLLDFAEFAVAFADGVLSGAHVDQLRRADRVETHSLLKRDQSDLIKAAETCTFADFEIVVQYWINAADPDGRLVEEQERSNQVTLRRYADGTVGVSGRLDAVLGTKVYNAVVGRSDRIAEQMDTPVSNDVAARYGSAGKRRAHALAQLVEEGHHSGATPAPPLLNVVMSEMVRNDLVAGRVPHLDPFDVDGRLEWLDGTPLHPCHAARLIASADMRRIVLNASSKAIDVSVKARLFPRWMKEVSLVETRGRCVEAGCDAPHHWMHADHRIPHSRGGPTRLDNCDPLCGPGNRAKGDRTPSDPDPPPDKPAA